MKDTDINGSLHYLDFICGGGRGEGVKNICIPHASQIGVTQSPTYQRSMGNLVPAGRYSVYRVLKLNKLDHFFKFSEVLNLVLACIYNEKD